MTETDPPEGNVPGRFKTWGIVFLAAALAGLLFLGAREWYYSGWMDDDAFISFRYAGHLAQGHGLVYNAGERVEGYSNFLWTLILAFFFKLGIGLPEAARALGCLFSILTILLLLHPRARAAADPGKAFTEAPWPLSGLAALLLCFLETWAVWAVGGLENTMGAFLVLLAFLTYFGGLENESRAWTRMATSGTFCALAALTHPSFALFGVVLGMHLLWRTAAGRSSAKVLIAFVLPIAFIGGPYIAWKISYYGHVLPNTFQAKAGITPAVVLRGFRYLGEAFMGLAVPFLSLLILPVLLVAKGIRDSRPRLLLAAAAAYGAYTVLIGGEAFPAYRLFVVILPLMCLLVQSAVALAAGGRGRALSLPLSAVILISILAVALPNHFSPRVRVLDRAIAEDSLGMFRATALELKKRLPPDTLFADSAAGVIAFYTGFPFLDTLGLTDARIAARRIETLGQLDAGHEKGDGAYVFSRRPNVVMFAGYPVSSFTPSFIGDYELLALPEFAGAYYRAVLILSFTPRGSPDEIQIQVPLYVRNDTRFLP